MNCLTISWRRALVAITVLLGTLVTLVGCGTFAPGHLPLGTPIAKVEGGFLNPTGRFALPNGGTRLEFSEGSYGRETFMLDFDRDGLLMRNTQVLSLRNFQDIAVGTSAYDVRFRLGRPAQIFGVAYQDSQVWNYRWFEGDCVWYQISISNQTHRVINGSPGPDPVCDGPNDRADWSGGGHGRLARR